MTPRHSVAPAYFRAHDAEGVPGAKVARAEPVETPRLEKERMAL